MVGYFLGLGDVGISGCEHLDSHDLSFECGIARVCVVLVLVLLFYSGSFMRGEGNVKLAG